MANDLDRLGKASDPKGPALVSARGEDIPDEHRHLARLVGQAIEKGRPVSSGKGRQRKVALQLDLPSGPHTILLKPFHEIPSRAMARCWGSEPLSGWAEMTHQAVYHAAGLGDHHQRVHVANAKINGRSTPLVAIHLEHNAVPLCDSEWGDLRHPHHDDVARKMAWLDTLQNVPDRHYSNLVVSPGGHLVAIDHGLALRFKHPKDEVDGSSIASHHRNSALDLVSTLIPPRTGTPYAHAQALADASYRPTRAWWKEVGGKIREVLQNRLIRIRDDSVRMRLQMNVQHRLEALDSVGSGASIWTPMEMK